MKTLLIILNHILWLYRALAITGVIVALAAWLFINFAK